jgi:hypothetical protein
MKSPKYTDVRYPLGYVTAEKSREPGYLQKRFQEIREKQKEEAAARLRNVISNRRFK